MQIAREEYANALENIEKCISLYNNEGRDLYLDLLLKRGCLLVMLGRYDEALKSLNLALAEDPLRQMFIWSKPKYMRNVKTWKHLQNV